MSERAIKICFWSFWMIIVSVCAYFIVHNAEWVIGDDALVINHTGSGKAFLPYGDLLFGASDAYASGRFYPFAYLAYDILLLFHDGYISPVSHYRLQAVFFVALAFSSTILLLKIVRLSLANNKPIIRYSLAFFMFVTIMGRVFQIYTECFTTIWCVYTLVSVFMLFSYLFYEKGKWIFGILALLCVNYVCYCCEHFFVIPLVMGACALLFQRKTLSQKEKVFNWVMVGSAGVFLLLYGLLVFPHIETAYDGSHGSDISLFGNALSMFIAQKIIIVAFIVFVVRVIDLIRHGKSFVFFDNCLLTAFGYCCGCAILRLNFVYYYTVATIICIPAILYFLILYLKPSYALGAVMILGIFYGCKIPKAIKYNQNHRISVAANVNYLVDKVRTGKVLCWYCPEYSVMSDPLYMGRIWKRFSLDSYLQWALKDENYHMSYRKEYVCGTKDIWLSASENEMLFPEKVSVFKDQELVFDADGILGYYCYSEKN